MTNAEIKQKIEDYAKSPTDDAWQDLFDMVTTKPDGGNNDATGWAENVIAAAKEGKAHKGGKEAAKLLLEAYNAYKAIHPNAFEEKTKILRMACNYQIEQGDMEAAHESMNLYLYNSLSQVWFKSSSVQKMHYFSFRSFSEYSLKDIENETISLAHPREFNDPLDTILVWWLDSEIRKGGKDSQDLAFKLLMKKAAEHIKIRCLIGGKYEDKGTWNEMV